MLKIYRAIYLGYLFTAIPYSLSSDYCMDTVIVETSIVELFWQLKDGHGKLKMLFK